MPPFPNINFSVSGINNGTSELIDKRLSTFFALNVHF